MGRLNKRVFAGTFFFWVVLAAIIISVFYFTGRSPASGPFTLLEFEEQLVRENVAAVEIEKVDEHYVFEARFREPVDGKSEVAIESQIYPKELQETLDAQGLRPTLHRKERMWASWLTNLFPFIFPSTP